MVLASDHKGGIGECWWAGHSPGWALTSHSLSAQGPWKSLTVVFTVLNEGQLQRTAAILRVGLGQEYIAVLPGGPLTSGGWGQKAVGSYGRAGRKARGQRRNSGFIESSSTSGRTVPFALKDGPLGLYTVARTPLLTPQVTKQGSRWAWQENVTWGFGGLRANARAGEAQAVLSQLGVGIPRTHQLTSFKEK